MAKDVITVDGEERVVREDTAKSYRGTIWALMSVAVFIVVAAILFFVFFGWSVGNDLKEPASAPTTERR